MRFSYTRIADQTSTSVIDVPPLACAIKFALACNFYRHVCRKRNVTRFLGTIIAGVAQKLWTIKCLIMGM